MKYQYTFGYRTPSNAYIVNAHNPYDYTTIGSIISDIKLDDLTKIKKQNGIPADALCIGAKLIMEGHDL